MFFSNKSNFLEENILDNRLFYIFKILIWLLLLIALIIITINFTLFLNLKAMILNPDFIIEALEQNSGYNDVKNYFLKMIRISLPNGNKSITYLNSIVTDSMIKSELDGFINDFILYIKNVKIDSPVISFLNFKIQIAEKLSLDNGFSVTENLNLVEYWLQPLPDFVRLEDFISLNDLTNLKNIIILIEQIPIISLLFFIILLRLFIAIFDELELVLFLFGISFMVSGIILSVFSFTTKFIIRNMTIFYNIEFFFSELGFENSINNIINDFIEQFNLINSIIGISLVLIGFLSIYLVPNNN